MPATHAPQGHRQACWSLPNLDASRRQEGDLDLALLFATRGHGSGGFRNLREALAVHAEQRSLLDKTRREYTVAVGGRIKAGKSTLLTALFGGQVHFPSGACVCTGVPTVVRRGDKGSRLIATWNDGRSPLEADPGELRNLASLASPGSRGVATLILELDNEGFPQGLRVIDTPGTQDPNMERSRAALAAIRNADLLLYAVSVRDGGTLQSGELDLIRNFLANPGCSVLVVLTMAELANSKEDLDRLLQQAREHLDPARPDRAEVLACSALAYLASIHHRNLALDSLGQTPDQQAASNQAQARYRQLQGVPPSAAALGDLPGLIRRVQWLEGYPECFGRSKPCFRLDCCWFRICPAGMGLPLATSVKDELPARWKRSVPSALELLETMQMFTVPNDGIEGADALRCGSRLDMVRDFLHQAWERKLTAAEGEIRQTLWSVAGGMRSAPEPSPTRERRPEPDLSQLNPRGMAFQTVPEHTAWVRRETTKGVWELGRVQLPKGFQMATTTVTRGQWAEIMIGPPAIGGQDRPVTGVSMDDITRFLRAINTRKDLPDGWRYRLPTTLEWEAAAQGGSVGEWCFHRGDEALSVYAWYGNRALQTQRVGQLKANAFGLHDMHGNVEEVAESGDGIWVCGGSFAARDWNTRSAERRRWDGNQDPRVGFRLVLTQG